MKRNIVKGINQMSQENLKFSKESRLQSIKESNQQKDQFLAQSQARYQQDKI